jgi:hypothetical protein
VVLDLEQIKTLEQDVVYENQDPEADLEKMFQVEAQDNPCSTMKMTIENNVLSIKTKDLGKDNDYVPEGL